MEPGAVPGECFDHMSKRMAVIENGSLTTLFFISSDNECFGLRRPFKQCFQQLGRNRERVVKAGGLLEQVEQIRISDHSVFDDLSETSPKFPQRKSIKRVWINHHQPWLVKGADQIFTAGMIHTSFSTNCGIHHGQ